MAYGARDEDQAVLCEWSIRCLREWLFLSHPPAKRHETLERVRHLATSRPDSYLAKNARKIYREER